MVLGQIDIHMPKKEKGKEVEEEAGEVIVVIVGFPPLYYVQKNDSKWIRDLNGRANAIKLLDENRSTLS